MKEKRFPRSLVLREILVLEFAFNSRWHGKVVSLGLGGLEPPASWSRTKRASHCATARKKYPRTGGGFYGSDGT